MWNLLTTLIMINNLKYENMACKLGVKAPVDVGCP
jgi:hypothetical protein